MGDEAGRHDAQVQARRHCGSGDLWVMWSEAGPVPARLALVSPPPARLRRRGAQPAPAFNVPPNSPLVPRVRKIVKSMGSQSEAKLMGNKSLFINLPIRKKKEKKKRERALRSDFRR